MIIYILMCLALYFLPLSVFLPFLLLTCVSLVNHSMSI